VAIPPPTTIELPAKGVVPPPTALKGVIVNGVPAGAAAGGLGFSDWVVAHPWKTAGIAMVAVGAISGAVYALNRWHQARHEAPTPNPLRKKQLGSCSFFS
jgi:hypothetical protein